MRKHSKSLLIICLVMAILSQMICVSASDTRTFEDIAWEVKCEYGVVIEPITQAVYDDIYPWTLVDYPTVDSFNIGYAKKIQSFLRTMPPELTKTIRDEQSSFLKVKVEAYSSLGRSAQYGGNGESNNVITLFGSVPVFNLHHFTHEYGHYVTYRLSNKYGWSTIKSSWKSLHPELVYEDEGGPVTGNYSYTSYLEDMAETFAYMMTEKTTTNRKTLYEMGTEAPFYKKIIWWRDMLNKAYNVPDYYLSEVFVQQPSAWAAEFVESYYNDVGTTYDTYLYQSPITRLDFANNVAATLNGLFKKRGGDYFYGRTGGKWYLKDFKTGHYVSVKDGQFSYSFDDCYGPDYGNVEIIYGLGIVNGISDTLFAPDNQITRQDAACMLARMCQLTGIEADTNDVAYIDSNEIADYAQESIKIVSSIGLMTGMDDGRFAPYETYTYEQAYTTFARFINYYIDNIGCFTQEYYDYIADYKNKQFDEEQSLIAQEMLILVNETRAKEGVSALTIHPELMEAAKILATEYAQGSKTHCRLDGSSHTTIMQELNMTIYFDAIYGQTSPFRIDKYDTVRWHNRVLQESKVKVIADGDTYYGVASVKGKNGNYYWVECFGFDPDGTTSTNSTNKEDTSSKPASDYTAKSENTVLPSQQSLYTSVTSALNTICETFVTIHNTIEGDKILLVGLTATNSNLDTINTRMNTENYNATEVITSAIMMNTAVNEIKTNLYQSGYDDSNSDMILLSQTQEIIKEIISKASSSVNSNGN